MRGDPTILVPTPSGWIAVNYETFRKGLNEANELFEDIRQPIDVDDAESFPTSFMSHAGDSTHTYDATLIDAQEAGRVFDVKPSWLLKRAREQRLPCVRFGKYVRFDPDEIREFFRREVK